MTVYQSIPHLPWSPGAIHGGHNLFYEDLDKFIQTPLVITEKLDGMPIKLSYNRKNTRLRGKSRLSINWLENWYNINYIFIPDGLEIFAEYCIEVNNIRYDLGLKHYINIYAAWSSKERYWYSQDKLNTLASNLRLPVVPIILETEVKNIYELQNITQIVESIKPAYGKIREGYVICASNPARSELYTAQYKKILSEDTTNNNIRIQRLRGA